MVPREALRILAAVLAGVAVSRTWAAEFTAARVSGEVQAGSSVSHLTAVKSGDVFGSGTWVRTGRDGQLGAQFDAQNTFAVMPETSVRVNGGAALRGAGVRLTLEQGRVESELGAWPAGSAYEVQSAAGTFVAHGTAFAVGYRLGPEGQFTGGAEVSRGEVEYLSPECNVPSLTANGGMSITRTVGLESVYLIVTANGNDLTLVVAGRHRLTVAAGTTVRIAVATQFMQRFVAVWVDSGSVTIGGQAVTPADRALFVSGTAVLPNGGGIAFMEAVRVEAGAHAQAQLPGLNAEQIAALQATQRSAARAIFDSATGAGVVPMYQPPFVPERPLSAPLSASGTP